MTFAEVDGEYFGAVNHRTSSHCKPDASPKEEAAKNGDQQIVIGYVWKGNCAHHEGKSGNCQRGFQGKLFSEYVKAQDDKRDIYSNDQRVQRNLGQGVDQQ